LKAQEDVHSQSSQGIHQHDGFYLSISDGLVMGNITDHTTPYRDYGNATKMNGSGNLADVKIGWAIEKNLLLHLTVVSNYLVGPKVAHEYSSWDPTYEKTRSTLSIKENMVGVGMTYYKMPMNIFCSGSLGIGYFSTRDRNNRWNNVLTDKGFSMQLKLGKEWWVANKLAIGAAFSFGKTIVKDRTDMGDIEKVISSRFGISFNTTFN
jgi:hypothetical protein